MPTCNICIDHLKKPVCLPCGHIFCTECIIKTIQAIKPQRHTHLCPICRSPYNIAPINPAIVPLHLRPHLTPSIRRVYINSTPIEEGQSSPQQDVSEELARLRSENHTLRSHCVLWRRRAEVHGAATLGLLDFARMVRDQAVHLAQERDELHKQCTSLKRKLEEEFAPSAPQTALSEPSPFVSPSPFTFARYPQVPGSHPAQPSLETSRMAVASLFDLHSYMNQAASSSSSSSSPRPPNLDLLSQSGTPERAPASSAATTSPSISGNTTTQSSPSLEPAKKRLRLDMSPPPVETPRTAIPTSAPQL